MNFLKPFKKLSIHFLLLVLIAVLIVTPVYAASGTCSVNESSGKYYADADTSTLLFDDYKSCSVFLYFDYQLAEADIITYDQHYRLWLFAETVKCSPPTGANRVTADGYHQVGSLPNYADFEWSSHHGIDLDKSSSSNLFDSLSVVSDSIQKYFSLDSKYFIRGYNWNKTNLNNYFSKVFVNSFLCNVEQPFVGMMKKGDYAPSYWFDTTNQCVYIGTMHPDKSYMVYKSTWSVNEANFIVWSNLVSVESIVRTLDKS